MRITRLFLLVLLALAVAGSASQGHIRKGINELSLRGSFDVVSANGSSTSSTEIGLGLGHSLSDRLQPGVNFSLVKLENVDAFGTVGGFLNYYLTTAPEATAVPYLGGRLERAMEAAMTPSSGVGMAVLSSSSSTVVTAEAARSPWSRSISGSSLAVEGSTTLACAPAFPFFSNQCRGKANQLTSSHDGNLGVAVAF